MSEANEGAAPNAAPAPTGPRSLLGALRGRARDFLGAPKDAPNESDAENERLLRSFYVVGGLLVFGVGGWAAFTSIEGAVVAPGQLVVESDVKKVQHPTGGVVGELLVREGSRVKAGDVVIRLDETQTRANLDIVLKAMDEIEARRARDEAEISGAEAVAFPAGLLERRSDPSVAHLVDGETKLFETRVSAREGQKAQLRERVSQLREEISGLTQQVAAKERETDLIGSELAGVRQLWDRKLVPYSRVTALERDAARLGGERGQLVASAASAKGKVSETELQIIQVDAEMRQELGKELAEMRGRWSELREKKVAAEDQLKRTDLKAPQDGVVHQMTVHTVGGLVTPNEAPMLIVPQSDDLVVEARIQPQDIDGVRLDQPATLKLTAFNQRTTPEVDGTVYRVSADVTQDQRTGLAYYVARIRVPEGERRRLGSLRLVPGMPVEAYVRTGSRTVLAYLTKPLMDQVSKAWRER